MQIAFQESSFVTGIRLSKTEKGHRELYADLQEGFTNSRGTNALTGSQRLMNTTAMVIARLGL